MSLKMCDKASLSDTHAAHLEKALCAFIEKEKRYERLKYAREKAELHGNDSKLDRVQAQLMVHLEKKDEEWRVRERCNEITEKRHALQKMQKERKKVLVLRKKMPFVACPPDDGAPQSPSQSEE